MKDIRVLQEDFEVSELATKDLLRSAAFEFHLTAEFSADPAEAGKGVEKMKRRSRPYHLFEVRRAKPLYGWPSLVEVQTAVKESRRGDTLKVEDKSPEGELEREARILAAEVERPAHVSERRWLGLMREKTAYERELPRLLADPQYRGKWVAFHDDGEVGCDEDFRTLGRRFRREHGADASVYIGPVAIDEDQMPRLQAGGQWSGTVYVE